MKDSIWALKILVGLTNVSAKCSSTSQNRRVHGVNSSELCV